MATRLSILRSGLPLIGLWLTACAMSAVPDGPADDAAGLSSWRTLQAAPDARGRFLQLGRPVAVAGWQDWIYIADAGRGTLYRYDRAADRLQAFRAMALAPGVRMVAHPAGGLYVTDPPNRRVLRLDPDGRIATVFRDFNLNLPVALADDPRGGRLLVLDGPYQQILAFNRLGRLEEVIHPRDQRGQPPGNLIDLAADANRFYLLDAARHEVLVTDRQGRYLRRFGQDVLKQPASLVRDPFGRVIVADAFDGRLWIFQPQARGRAARFVTTNAGRITDLAVSEPWLLAADDGMGAVHVFRLVPPAPERRQ